jgi:hypothetical protein
MKNNFFYSSNTYLLLPTKANPRVALVIDDKGGAVNSFKLYNPFSLKAKLMKLTVFFLFKHLPYFSKILFKVEKKCQSDFLKYLENKLGQPLISSVYSATTGDKVVIQLQTYKYEIIGYIKYPLNEIGRAHLENEQRAIEVLSKKKITKEYIMRDQFKNEPFLLLYALDGKIELIDKVNVSDILSLFKREITYTLAAHPRIIQLQSALNDLNLEQYSLLVTRICKKSTFEYSLVYEHGDFTPWNIVKVADKYVPFDFEHFVENGLEYLDLFKFYYQIGKLLKYKKDLDLISYIRENIDIMEFDVLFQIFLVKEILRNCQEGEPCGFEIKMLTYLDN